MSEQLGDSKFPYQMTVFVPKTPGRAPGFFLSIHTRDNIMKLFAQGTYWTLAILT